MQVYGRFAGIYDSLMSDVDRDEWAKYLLSFLEKDDSVIADAACGTGELSLRFAAAGYNTIGIDVSEDMLFIAAEKARKQALNIPFICQDMRELSLHNRVDAVISACDGVNYLLKDDDASAFFASARSALRPGGLLMFDISSDYKLSQILSCNTFAEEQSDCAYIWHNMYDPKSRLIKMELTFFERRYQSDLYERFSETHIQRAYYQNEIMLLLNNAGFKDILIYDAFTRKAPRKESERLQFIAVAASDIK